MSIKHNEEQQSALAEYLEYKELHDALTDKYHLLRTKEAINAYRELKAYIKIEMYSLFKIHKVENI